MMQHWKRQNKTPVAALIVVAVMISGLFAATLGAAQTKWFDDGLNAMTEGRYDAAIVAFTRALEIAPDDYEAYNNRGIAYAKKSLPNEAEADFTRAIALNPDFHDAYVNRGIERQKQGFIDSALVDYHRALTLAEGDTTAQLLLAWVLATWPDARFRDGPLAVKLAEGLITPAAADNPWDLLAAAYAEAGRFDQAIEAQKKYIDQLIEAGMPREEVDAYRRRLDDFNAGKPLRNWVMKTRPVDDDQAARTMSMLKRSLGRESPKAAEMKPEAGPPADDTALAPLTTGAKAVAREETPPTQSTIEPARPQAAASEISDRQPYPYVLVIASLRDGDLGLQTTQQFQRKGDPAFSSWVYTSASGNWYQIYIGWYADEERAGQMAAQLKERRFRQVVISRAPLAVKVGDIADGDDLDALEARLDTLGIVGYRLGGRLLVGAYKVKPAAKTLIEQLEKAALPYQWVER